MESINSLRRAAIAIVLVIATLFGAMAITPAGPADATYEPPTIAFGRLEAIATAGNAGGDPVVNFFAIDGTYSDPFGAIRFRNTTDDRFRGQVDCVLKQPMGRRQSADRSCARTSRPGKVLDGSHGSLMAARRHRTGSGSPSGLRSTARRIRSRPAACRSLSSGRCAEAVFASSEQRDLAVG